jgi:hypothetical protein
MKHSSPDWLPIKPSAGIRLWGVGIFLLWSLMAVMTVYWHLQGEAQDVMFHLLIWLLGLGPSSVSSKRWSLVNGQ